jgi:hypothetical protein
MGLIIPLLLLEGVFEVFSTFALEVQEQFGHWGFDFLFETFEGW